MKLYDFERDEHFDVSFSWPSQETRDILADLGIERTTAMALAEEEHPEIKKLSLLLKDEQRARLSTDPILNVENQQCAKKLQRILDIYTIEVFRLGLTARGLSEHQRALIASAPESPFWRKQDWGTIDDGARRFRLACATGRPANSFNSAVGDIQPSGSTGEEGGGVEGDVAAADSIPAPVHTGA